MPQLMEIGALGEEPSDQPKRGKREKGVKKGVKLLALQYSLKKGARMGSEGGQDKTRRGSPQEQEGEGGQEKGVKLLALQYSLSYGASCRNPTV